jgi:hypothetical protein
MLCDTQISQKCKYHIDSDYYCEYKLYDFYAFKNIIADDGLEANGIAKYYICSSLSVTENLQRIIRYISEEGSDLLLNFVTFDDKFVVKAISKKEQKIFLKEKLEGYYDRVMDNSFLQHIYGIFKLTIKGQDYSIAILENNPAGFISRGSISVSSTGSGIELVHFAGEPDEHNKFFLDQDSTAHFKETLKKDLEYLNTSNIHYCKIFIDILGEPHQGSREVYTGIYQGKMSYLSVRIYDVFYTGVCLKSKRLLSNGVQNQFNQGSLSKIESMLETYIRF